MPRSSSESLVRFSEEEANRLIRFYTDVEREILDQLNRALLRGNKTEYLAGMKKNIQTILSDLQAGNRTWCEKVIPRVYSKGAAAADGLIKAKGQRVISGFGSIHQQAAQVLAENTLQSFNHIVQLIGRRTEGIYRDLALENIRGSVVGYQSWQQVARRYREQLSERGVTGFKDAKGRNWNMKTYAEMVARTSTMEAHLQGTANRLLEHGHDLVKISRHANECKLCRPWEGKILSLTGKTKGYPTLQEAKEAGLFHPNCRHAYGLYIDFEEKEQTYKKVQKQQKKPQYYTEVPDLTDDGKTGLADAFARALDFGRQNGRECLLTIDAKTGIDVYSRVEGGKDYVQFSDDLSAFLAKAKANSVISIHNHPGSSSFSDADLRVMAKYKSISHLMVIGHDGTRYVVKIGQGSRPTSREISIEWKAAHDRHFNYFNNKVGAGELAPKDAWKEHTHLIAEEVANKFGWEYRRVMPNER